MNKIQFTACRVPFWDLATKGLSKNIIIIFLAYPFPFRPHGFDIFTDKSVGWKAKVTTQPLGTRVRGKFNISS